MPLSFGINHQAAPRLSLDAFFDLARDLDVEEVEIRNDIATPVLDGISPTTVREKAAAHNVRIASINALQRFNDWSGARRSEAEAMIAYAQSCGAAAIVLCPVNDPAFRRDGDWRLDGLRTALDALTPLLRDAGLISLVEPLGFAECSLRSKREAVDAIVTVGSGDVFRLVHDTFHHYVAGEPELFAERTGLVHVSGVVDATVPTGSMRDSHRVLVDEHDRLDNVGQIKALLDSGYKGVVSFEPFAPSVAELEDARPALAASMAHLRRGIESR